MRATPSALILIFLVAGCTEPGAYPLTGAPCGPDDPVRTLDAADCLVPAAR